MYWLLIEQTIRANEFLQLCLVNVPINMLIMSLCWPVSIRLGRIDLCCSLEWTSVQCQSMLSIVVSLFQFPFVFLPTIFCSFITAVFLLIPKLLLISVLLFLSVTTLGYAVSYVSFFKA